MSKLLFGISLIGLSFVLQPAYGQSLRVGKHSISLQWIDWEKVGTATISLKNGKYFIKGFQKSDKTADSLNIEGELTVINAKELRFTGKIFTQVSYVNNGQPCLRDGTYTFKATGNRRFWRLQEMTNCEQNNVVDYVDIYF
jgi:hypothetical protein